MTAGEDELYLHRVVCRRGARVGTRRASGGAGRDATFHAFALLGLAVGTIGVTGLVVGCTMMVRETGLAVDFLSEELDLVGQQPPSAPPL